MSILFTKYRLINWHYFSDTGIMPIGPCYTLITGKSAAGKSTIADAFDTVIYACTSGNYNKAAEGKGSRFGEQRTLAGFMRGYDVKNNTYKRNGKVITHLAMEAEIRDEGCLFAESIVIGCQFILEKNRYQASDISKLWWAAPGKTLDDIAFISENGDRKEPYEFDKMIRPQLGSDLRTATTNTQGTAMMQTVLGLSYGLDNAGADRIKSLHKAQNCFRAFNPQLVSNESDFVAGFILEPSPIEIQGLKENLEKAKEARDTFSNLCAERDELNEIRDIAAAYEKTILDHQTQKDVLAILRTQIAEEQLNRDEQSINRLQTQIEELEKQRKTLDSEIDALSLAKLELESGSGKEFGSLKASIREKQALVDSYARCKNTLNLYLEKIMAAAETVNHLCGAKRINTGIVEKYMAGEADTSDEIEQLIATIYNEARNIMSQLIDTERKLREINERRSELNRTIAGLEAGKPSVSAKLSAFLSLLKKEFDDNGIKDDPTFLYQMIEFTDETWAYAAETYMGQARFNICVMPENYRLASEFLKKVRTEGGAYNQDFHGIYIIDTESFRTGNKEFTAARGSLAEIIRSDNPYVQAYINRAYSRVHLVEDVITPEDRNGVYLAKDGRSYEGRRTGSREKVRMLYVGKKALESQLNALYEERNLLAEQYREVEKNRNALNEAESVMNDETLRAVSVNFFEMFLNANLLVGETEDLSRLKEKLEALQTSAESENNKKQLQAIQDEIIAKSKARDRIRDEDVKKQSDLKALQDRQDKTRNEMVESEDRVEEMTQDEPDKLEAAQNMLKAYKAEHKRYGNQTIADNFSDMIAESGTKYAELHADLKQSQKAFSRHHMTGYACDGITSMLEYNNRYKRLSSAQLPEIDNQANQALEDARGIFMESCIGALYQKIMQAKSELRRKNQDLKAAPFNGTVFQFSRVEANSQYREYYNAIMEVGRHDTSDDLIDTSSFTEETQVALQKLFTQLSDDTRTDSIPLLDYRQYCTFGIEAVSIDSYTGEESRCSLSSWNGTGSGSEVEIPGYVILGAAIASKYNKDSMRFAIADEAFSKSDDAKTDMVIKYLTDTLGLQLVAITPSRTADSLGARADTIAYVRSNPEKKTRRIESILYRELCEVVEGDGVDEDEED